MHKELKQGSTICYAIIKLVIIQVRPPKDFGPKAQNLEGVRTCLRICGMEIISSKNSKKHFPVFSDKICPFWSPTDRGRWKKFMKNSKNVSPCFRTKFVRFGHLQIEGVERKSWKNSKKNISPCFRTKFVRFGHLQIEGVERNSWKNLKKCLPLFSDKICPFWSPGRWKKFMKKFKKIFPHVFGQNLSVLVTYR